MSQEIKGKFPPVPPLTRSEQKVYPTLDKETKIMNLDFRNSNKVQPGV
jgi:hypothetical protein